MKIINGINNRIEQKQIYASVVDKSAHLCEKGILMRAIEYIAYIQRVGLSVYFELTLLLSEKTAIFQHCKVCWMEDPMLSSDFQLSH